MLDFIITLTEYDQDKATQNIWSLIQKNYGDLEGIGYYKHPVLTTLSGVTPEITLITREYQPIIIRCLPFQIDDIQTISDDFWTINDSEKDSPLLEIDDFETALRSKYDRTRSLRKLFKPVSVLALPNVPEHDFKKKYGGILDDFPVIWADENINHVFKKLERPLSDEEFRLG